MSAQPDPATRWATISCMECGGIARLLSHPPPDEPFQAGDILAYRCVDCSERWDVVLDEDAIGEESPHR